MTLTYPYTRVEDVQDTLAGVSFPDPYRWLEQESDEVRQWQRAQANLASVHVREWPHFDQLEKVVARYSTGRPERSGGVPRYAGGRWFRAQVAAGASQAQAVVSDEPIGSGRVLFDPALDNPERPPYLSWISPSPDGQTLAIGVCVDGSESNAIRLINVSTGEELAQPPNQIVMDNWAGGVQWLSDSSGFFFTGIEGSAIELQQRVYLHQRQPIPGTKLVDIPWTGTTGYRMVLLSRDGRHAVAVERLHRPVPVAVAALEELPPRWRPFVTTIDGTVAGHIIGDHYIAMTDVGAPRGRLVSIPLNAKNPNDTSCWKELIAESDAVLRTVTPVDSVLYLTEFVDTYSRVRIVSYDGNNLGEVPLPMPGAVGELPLPFAMLCPRGHPDKYVFSFSSLTVSPGIYCHQPGADRLETIREPQVRLEHAVVEDRWAVSADGTHIPYHIVRRSDVHSNVPQPTLIYAYGGYNAPLIPEFPGSMAAFVAVGGVFVHAHLRGGGEFGLKWWQDGRLKKKQNGYNDLYAVAEDLIQANRCTPRTLAVTGGSNGGLMAAVAITQRPDLWAVAVPRVPKLDQIGHCRYAYGRQSTKEENADIDDPEEVRRLATFSPYHLVRDGIEYPAVFLDAGDTDPRCPPWHARKFAARMQRASRGAAPVLLHVWENVGHGWATDKKVAVTEATEWLGFTLRHLGVRELNV